MSNFAKLSAVQAAIISNARIVADDATRKAIKASVFADVKRTFGIPAHVKVKASVDADSDNYCILHVGGTGHDAGMAFQLDAAGMFNGVNFNPQYVAPAPAVDTRKWFSVTLARLIDLHKDDSFLDADDATDDLPPGIDDCPGLDFIAHDGDVYFLAEPDNT